MAEASDEEDELDPGAHLLHKGRPLITSDTNSLLLTTHPPLCGFQAVVDTALENPASALSNAVSTTAWKTRSEWLACKGESESAGLSCIPVSNHIAIT